MPRTRRFSRSLPSQPSRAARFSRRMGKDTAAHKKTAVLGARGGAGWADTRADAPRSWGLAQGGIPRAAGGPPLPPRAAPAPFCGAKTPMTHARPEKRRPGRLGRRGWRVGGPLDRRNLKDAGELPAKGLVVCSGAACAGCAASVPELCQGGEHIPRGFRSAGGASRFWLGGAFYLVGDSTQLRVRTKHGILFRWSTWGRPPRADGPQGQGCPTSPRWDRDIRADLAAPRPQRQPMG